MDMDSENTEKGPKAKNCCENHYQTFEIDDDYHSSFAQLILNLDFVIALVHTFLNIALFSETEKSPYAHYSPPSCPVSMNTGKKAVMMITVE